MKNNLKFLISTILIIFTIGYMWYLSEPKFDNNITNTIKKYDIVAVSPYTWRETETDVDIYMVLQKDSNSVFVKRIDQYYMTKYKVITITDKIHIIGHGTIYHKVNQMIGV